MRKISFLKGSLISTAILAASFASAENKINGALQSRLELSVTAAIVFNQTTNYETWHTSSANFHGIFHNVMERESLLSQVSVCDAVSNITVEEDGQAVKQPRPVEHLVLMESEISDPEFAPLFKDCKSDLLSKINEYFNIKVAELNQQYPPISKVALTQVETIVKKIENKKGGVLAAASEVLGENEIILTFDDGPVVENTVQVLDALKAHNIKAIFFPVGSRIKGDKAKLLMKRIKEEGHPIGNHSFTHPGFRSLLKNQGEAACLEEISKTHQAVWDSTGKVYPYFRFPGGTANEQLQAMVDARRLLNWRWNMDPEDFNTPDPAQVVAKSIALFEKKKSGIFLFHDIKPQTAIAIPIILKELLARGAKPTILIPVDPNEVENPHPDLVKKH